jgi:HAD superfamily hydrolase (TIGR01509 family)
MAIRDIVWDMDGTLLDTAQAVPGAFISAVSELGGRVVDRSEVLSLYPVGPPEAILARLLGRELAVGDAEAYYRRLKNAQVEPFPGVPETLSVLRSQGMRINVFTGASHRAAAVLLETAQIQHDVLLGGDEVEHPKPAPDGLLLIAEKLGRTPSEIAYVGDSPLDMDAAHAAGCEGWSPSWGHMFDHDTSAHQVLAKPSDVVSLLSMQ